MSAVERQRLFVALVVAYGALGLTALFAAALVFRPLFSAIALPFSPLGLDPAMAGLILWIGVCLATSSRQIPGTGQVPLVFSTGPMMAAALLGGPAAAAAVAFAGTVQVAELRRGDPWSVVLARHGMRTLCATVAAVAVLAVRLIEIDPIQTRDLVAILVGTVVLVVMEQGLGLGLWHADTGRPVSEGFRVVSRADWNLSAVAEACLAWLVALAYFGGLWWAPILIIVAVVATSRSMAHHEATWQLRHHPLTNLPNGRALREHVDALRRHGSPSSMCLVYLDLDGFKAVNDEHGHDVGDDVLREIGRRFGEITGPDMFMAHLHGDEFVALVAAIADERAVTGAVDRLRSTVEVPFMHPVGELKMSAATGTQVMLDFDDLGGAMRAADRKMLATKSERARIQGRERRRS